MIRVSLLGPRKTGCPFVTGPSVRLEKMVKSILQYLGVMHSPNFHNCSSWHDLLMPCSGLCLWPSFLAWVTIIRKKWLSLYYSAYWCYIHQTCTNCSSWHDLLMSCGGLCPWPTFPACMMYRKKWLSLYDATCCFCAWPTFHAWVTMVSKKWLSLYYSTYGWYIHQTYPNCPSWHDLLMQYGGLWAWPTFHAWVTMVWKKWLSVYYSTYECYIHQTYTNCLSWHDLLMPRGGAWPTFHASVTKTQNGNSRAPVMVPITIMFSLYDFLYLCLFASCQL